MPAASLDKGSIVQRVLIGGSVAAIVCLVVVMVLMASVPPVSRDALTHHLSIPKLFLQHGILAEFPDIPFSYYPMNLDLLYLVPLALGSDIAAKYVHLFFGLLTAGLIYNYLRRRTPPLWALAGSLLWLSIPVVVRLATEVYVDLGLAFFSLAAMCACFRWAEPDGRLHHLVFAGAWCGLALGTKYNALLVLAILALLIPFICLRLKPLSNPSDTGPRPESAVERPLAQSRCVDRPSVLRALAATVLFCATALMVFSPWMIRNAHLKGNPLYPMLNRVFKADNTTDQPDWSRTATMVQDTSNTLTVRRLVFKESPAYIALIPLRVFFEGRDDDPRYFDGRLNPFLLVFMLSALALGHFQSPRLAIEGRIWFAFACLFMLMAFFLAPIRIRYLLPILPAICILTVIGIYSLTNRLKLIDNTVARYTGAVLLVAAVVGMYGYNAAYVAERFNRVAPLAFLRGQVSRSEYISRHLPEYPLIQMINTTTAADARILALFLGQRRYYFDREVIFNEGYLTRILRENESPEAIRQALRAARITHIILRRDLFDRWLGANVLPDDRPRLAYFWRNNIKNIKNSGLYSLFSVQ